jgi:hypothetical protein
MDMDMWSPGEKWHLLIGSTINGKYETKKFLGEKSYRQRLLRPELAPNFFSVLKGTSKEMRKRSPLKWGHRNGIWQFLTNFLYFHDLVTPYYNPVTILIAESRYFWLNLARNVKEYTIDQLFVKKANLKKSKGIFFIWSECQFRTF